MADEIRILIADDHPIFRDGLRQLIEKEPGFRVVAEAADGNAALELLKAELPAIAVLDLDMPGLDGFAVAEQVQKLVLPVQIIILTMHKDELHLNRAIGLGVSGFVVKDGAASEIVNCLRSVNGGNQYISPALSGLLLGRRRAENGPQQFGLAELTPTERRVLYLLSDLKTSREVAADLGVSPRTIENHRAHICSKLGLQGTHALVKFALEHRGELG